VGTGAVATGLTRLAGEHGDVVVWARSAESSSRAREEMGRRSRVTTELEELSGCTLVVEAVVEDLPVKQALFANLDEIVRPGAVLATTTSSLPVIECAAATGRPRDVVGMHFFNPAPVMKLVEVVSTVSTKEDVAETVRALCSEIGKVPVSCGDRAGFIVNALLFPYLNDAIKMLEAHYATADDIDTAMKQGCALPMGPFELLDVVGNDVSLAIQRTLYLEFREPGFAPAPLLEHLVTAGFLGRKTGRGFRDYTH
jgi:3-hydroxybutyryl-CoA dehydrogenase